MTALKKVLLLLPFYLLLAACATLSPYYEKPTVSITSFTLSPESAGFAPKFNIGLHVVNPNRVGLPLQGMTYSVDVQGNRLLTGATADLPHVPAYGSADIVIEASPDLFGSARLLNQLLTGTRDSLDYAFKARLDVGSMLPFITIEEKGTFGLTQ